MRSWTTKETAEIIGVPLSTLDSWAARGAVIPTIPAQGRGTGRRFVFRDVVLCEVAHVLAGHAVALDAIGAIVSALREHWPDDGQMFVSPAGGILAMGGIPGDPFDPAAVARAVERGGWLIHNTNHPDSGFGDLLFVVNVANIARRIWTRIEELDRG